MKSETVQDLGGRQGEASSVVQLSTEPDQAQRSELVRFAANFSKHRLLRLAMLMEQLRKLAASSGVTVQGTELVALREPFLAEIQSRLIYLASWLVELLGTLWGSLNAIVAKRSQIEATNHVARMRIPAGVTSDAIRNLYGDTLVFKSYDPDRISRFVPRVPELLKRRY